MSSEDALIVALRNRIDVLEDEIQDLKGTIHGQERFGWTGLMSKAKTLESKQQELRGMLAAFEAREEKREWETQRRDKTQKALLSATLAIVVPLAVQALSGLFFGG